MLVKLTPYRLESIWIFLLIYIDFLFNKGLCVPLELNQWNQFLDNKVVNKEWDQFKWKLDS